MPDDPRAIQSGENAGYVIMPMATKFLNPTSSPDQIVDLMVTGSDQFIGLKTIHESNKQALAKYNAENGVRDPQQLIQ